MLTRVKLAAQSGGGPRGLAESQGHLLTPGGLRGEAEGPVLAEGGS